MPLQPFFHAIGSLQDASLKGMQAALDRELDLYHIMAKVFTLHMVNTWRNKFLVFIPTILYFTALKLYMIHTSSFSTTDGLFQLWHLLLQRLHPSYQIWNKQIHLYWKKWIATHSHHSDNSAIDVCIDIHVMMSSFLSETCSSARANCHCFWLVRDIEIPSGNLVHVNFANLEKFS